MKALLQVLLRVGVGAVVAVAAMVTLPTFVGLQSYTIMSNSMVPVLHAGDVIINEVVSPGDLQVGDVTTFPDPSETADTAARTTTPRLITHRVRSVQEIEGGFTVITMGDANSGSETWTTTNAGTVGRARLVVPRIGYLLSWVRTPLGQLLFTVVPAVAGGTFALRRIWGRKHHAGSVAPEAGAHAAA